MSSEAIVSIYTGFILTALMMVLGLRMKDKLDQHRQSGEGWTLSTWLRVHWEFLGVLGVTFFAMCLASWAR